MPISPKERAWLAMHKPQTLAKVDKPAALALPNNKTIGMASPVLADSMFKRKKGGLL